MNAAAPIFPSLAPETGRRVLRVNEVAARWAVSSQHVTDLLEEGQMNGFDIAGRCGYLRVPAAGIAKLATRVRLPREQVLAILLGTPPTRRRPARAHWRIPVAEGFQSFMRAHTSAPSAAA